MIEPEPPPTLLITPVATARPEAAPLDKLIVDEGVADVEDGGTEDEEDALLLLATELEDGGGATEDEEGGAELDGGT